MELHGPFSWGQAHLAISPGYNYGFMKQPRGAATSILLLSNPESEAKWLS
jgi:hypothetical protein